MGNINGNGWNQKRNGARYSANGALAHDLNNGWNKLLTSTSQKPAKPWGIDAYGMGNMNGNGWNQKRNSASYGANGALAHDLNNGWN